MNIAPVPSHIIMCTRTGAQLKEKSKMVSQAAQHEEDRKRREATAKLKAQRRAEVLGLHWPIDYTRPDYSITQWLIPADIRSKQSDD